MLDRQKAGGRLWGQNGKTPIKWGKGACTGSTIEMKLANVTNNHVFVALGFRLQKKKPKP